MNLWAAEPAYCLSTWLFWKRMKEVGDASGGSNKVKGNTLSWDHSHDSSEPGGGGPCSIWLVQSESRFHLTCELQSSVLAESSAGLSGKRFAPNQTSFTSMWWKLKNGNFLCALKSLTWTTLESLPKFRLWQNLEPLNMTFQGTLHQSDFKLF